MVVEDTQHLNIKAMSKSEKIRAYLRKHPNAKIETMSKYCKCSPGLVYYVIAEDRKKRNETDPHKGTPTLTADNARKTPQNAPTGIENKRVVVKKSFLWGAFKFERYE